MGEVKIRLDEPYPKQREFFEANTRYVAYGGARGGGKSWAARVKLILLALGQPGIQMLLLRRTYPQLRENHILTLQKMLGDAAAYRESQKAFEFPNGSRLKLGYCSREADVLQYQGQAYDVIVLEEATQFTEFQFQALTECNRSSGQMQGEFLPRMYLTCNPGGVGHNWVKRLFIDRDYRGSERGEDYTFIRSNVYDNAYLMEHSPHYVRTLENLPENRRRAMLYGDWDLFEGQYFSEFRREIHVCRPFGIPQDWRRYVSLDYGLDMLACYWIAMDSLGNAWVYRELYESALIVSDAAQRIREWGMGEKIQQYFAPPDLWNRRQDTGRSAAEIFARQGIYLTRASNDRVNGWLSLKEWLKPYGAQGGGDDSRALEPAFSGGNLPGDLDSSPADSTGSGREARLKIFESCRNLIRCLPAIQFDPRNPNDCAVVPHEVTHACDALRYFAVSRPLGPPREPAPSWEEELEQVRELIEYGI